LCRVNAGLQTAGTSPEDASYKAVKVICDKTDGASDPAVVEVFRGKHKGMLSTENIMVLAQGEPALEELS